MALVSIFCIFCYASIAFHTERLQKQSFMGRETYEQSFNRWLKIFDTFPEGMAMIKDDGSVMYANKSLTRILEIPELPAQGKEQHSQVCVSEDQGLNTRKALERTHIKMYNMRQTTQATFAQTPDALDEHQTVWQFVFHHQGGAMFELEQKSNFVQEATRRQLTEFTQSIMNLVDDYANNASQQLKDPQPTLKQTDQLALLQDRQSEIYCERYSIHDLQYIHDVAEHKF